jgi:hypothetical protein
MQNLASHRVLQIFGKDIVKYITIVRTKFEDFEFSEECDKDKEKLKGDKKLSKIINSCNGMVYVDNRPLHDKKDLERKKEDRYKSRKMLLECLASCQGSYKLEN